MKGNPDTVQLGVFIDKKYSDWLKSKGSRSGEIARLVTEAYRKEKLAELESVTVPKRVSRKVSDKG